jgi:serine/threonine protein kinase
VSPDNILVRAGASAGDLGGVGTDDVALIDFGLAQWRGGGPPSDGATRGTLLYVAPEVARGERFDTRADDFALAAALFTLATGTPLRDARGTAAVLAEAGSKPFDATHPGQTWRDRATELFPRSIADALLACLAFDPRDRPPTTPKPVLHAGA